MKIKVAIFAIMLMFASFLVGFDFIKSSNPLMNESRKVIDLQKAIELARPGGDANDNDINAEEEPSSEPKEDNVTTDSSELKPTNYTSYIIVSGKQVEIDGKTIKDITDVEKTLEESFNPQTTFDVNIDYAETNTYKKLVDILERLQTKIGLKYSIQALNYSD